MAVIIQLEVAGKIIKEEKAANEKDLYKYYLIFRKEVQDSLFEWKIYVTRKMPTRIKMDAKLRYRMIKVFNQKDYKYSTSGKIKSKTKVQKGSIFEDTYSFVR